MLGPEAVPNVKGVVLIAVIVIPVGKGVSKLFGNPVVFKVTVVPTTNPEISAIRKEFGLTLATQRSDVAAWLGVAKRTELAASARTVRIRDVFFI